jgi:hypothetical protein
MIGANSAASALGIALALTVSLKVEEIAGTYLVLYNIAYAIADLVVMFWAGFKLKFYIKAVFPRVSTDKITDMLTTAVLCYFIRSLVNLGLILIMQAYPHFKSAAQGIYWACVLVMFYCITDLLFLSLVFRIIGQQNQQNQSLRYVKSERSSKLIDDSESFGTSMYLSEAL